MQSPKLAKALFLSVITLVAGYAAAESSGRSDSIPSRPNHQSIAERVAERNAAKDSMMADCQKMHEQMHRDMMQKDSGSE